MKTVSSSSPVYLVIAGPTGSGKSALAMAIARDHRGEIVSCDSVQVYRRFNVGSAKPSEDDRRLIRHHLIDIVDATEGYDAARFAADARRAIAEILGRGRLPIVVGGTGLYLRALLEDRFDRDLPRDETLRLEFAERSVEDLLRELRLLDPERAKEIHPNDRIRISRALEINKLTGHPVGATKEKPKGASSNEQAFVVVLTPAREALHRAIEARTDQMLSAGWVDETRRLVKEPGFSTSKPMQSIGYKQIAACLAGEAEETALRQSIIVATRQYAKRQDTWFKKVQASLRVVSSDLDTQVTQVRDAAKAAGIAHFDSVTTSLK